jgi:hypothetical protein
MKSVLHRSYISCRRRDGIRAGRPGFDSRQGQEIVLFTASRTVLEPTQPPIQWTWGGGSIGWGAKLTTHLHLLSRLNMVELYLHSPIHLHDVVKNKLGTGITSNLFTDFNVSPRNCISRYLLISNLLEMVTGGCRPHVSSFHGLLSERTQVSASECLQVSSHSTSGPKDAISVQLIMLLAKVTRCGTLPL